MKCKKCNAEVSIAESKCPRCGNDLLQFGATSFYEPKEREGPRFGQTIKDVVIQEVSKDIKDGLENLGPWERKVLLPIENRLKTLFARHLSDSEIENVFESEIIPATDAFLKEKAAEKIFKEVEKKIKDNLGQSAFNHYQNKGEDVLRILRAGEITCILIKENTKDIDLSVKMFPFFKASEVACHLHIHDRYQELKNNPFIKGIAEWMGNDIDNIFIKEIPEWLVDRKKTFLEVVKGIHDGNEYYISGSLRTGISLYIMGREWILKIERRDLSKMKEFQISNILKTKGTNKDKELLAEILCNLQVLRNPRVHGDIENNERTVQMSRELSYNCLKQISEILEI